MNHEPPFFRDARIKLHVTDIKFYQDSVDWNRLYYGPFISKTWPIKIDTVNLSGNAVYFKSNETRRLMRADSVQLIEAGRNNGVYRIKQVVFEDGFTKLYLKEPLQTYFHGGRLTYFQKYDKNCFPDLWQKYTESDSSALHIFLTGSHTEKGSFGCGPSPYYLNFSNIHLSGVYGAAQLLTHEIGHCLGLYHTDYPQFDDLPRADRFCSCPCDSTEVSNNIMGYNTCRRYLSPKQVGHIHRRYNTDPTKIKTRMECIYNPKEVRYVMGKQQWNRGYVLPGDLVVKKGAVLEVNCMLSMPEGSTIYLEKKAKLIVNGVITNACGGTWNGIKTLSRFGRTRAKTLKPHQRGELILNAGGVIESVPY